MPGEKDLHPYQKFCVDFLEEKPQCALFLDCGLGKTIITLTAISHLLYDSYEVSRVLIIAPLRVARDTWIDELSKWDHLKGLRMERILGTPKERVQALSRKAELYVINRENVEWLVKHYAGRKLPFDMLVIDELSSFKKSRAKRFLALKKVLGQFSRVVGLTGTPAPNGLEDLWPQVFLLDRGQRLGRTVQFSDTGLYPAQADNARHLTRDTLGVPVVAAGIPTLMQAEEGRDLVVTPRDLDGVIAHGAALLGVAINRALQPKLSVAQLCWLVG